MFISSRSRFVEPPAVESSGDDRPEHLEEDLELTCIFFATYILNEQFVKGFDVGLRVPTEYIACLSRSKRRCYNNVYRL